MVVAMEAASTAERAVDIWEELEAVTVATVAVVKAAEEAMEVTVAVGKATVHLVVDAGSPV